MSAIISNQTFRGDGLYLDDPTEVVGCTFTQIMGDNHHGLELRGGGRGVEYVVEDCVF